MQGLQGGPTCSATHLVYKVTLLSLLPGFLPGLCGVGEGGAASVVRPVFRLAFPAAVVLIVVLQL